MNLVLTRKHCRPSGIFGELTRLDNKALVAITLEHAYPHNQKWQPKVPSGTYSCVRGTHRLPNHSSSFETFEITNVPGHTGILFHCGNFDRDSEGCVLLGSWLNTNPWEIVDSRLAFVKFMTLQKDVEAFLVTIIDI